MTGPMETREVNFDGLVGPTHNYAGLAHGNLASTSHHGLVSNPKAAALEGLSKMRLLLQLGVPQALLPPHPRPNWRLLHQLGFSGKRADVLSEVSRSFPRLLAASYSASAMWTANAATVCASADALDARVHLTPANLASLLHRSQESEHTTRVLRSVFHDVKHFVVHDPLPGGAHFADEGAANHTRMFGSDNAHDAVHVFAWGRSSQHPALAPRQYPARQALEASEAIARLHRLRTAPLLWQQAPDGIDAGAFHTDVLAVGSHHVLLLHERAFVDPQRFLSVLDARLRGTLAACLATEAELPVADAIAGYAFNSQLVTLPNGRLQIIAPAEAEESKRCCAYLQRAVDEVDAIDGVTFVSVRQSMANGGGPACLRLRVPLTPVERTAIHPQVLLDGARLDQLQGWVDRHYRDRLSPAELADPLLAEEAETALAELATILRLNTLTG